MSYDHYFYKEKGNPLTEKLVADILTGIIPFICRS